MEKDWTSGPTIQHYGKSKSFYVNFSCLCICVFISTVNTIIVASALPAIAKGLNATTTEAYWTGSVVTFTQCITQPIIGAFAESFGRKFCMIVALTIFTAASALGGTAQNIQWLIGARVLQGLGGGAINVLVNVIIVDLVPQRERAKYNGLISLAGASGLAAGLLCGAALAQINWRWVFFLNIPICIPTLIGFVFFLRLNEERKSFITSIRNMDWIGMVVLASSLGGLLFATMSGGSVYPWSSWHIIVPLLVGVFGILAFVGYEHWIAGRGILGPPFVPLELFGNRTAAAGYLVTFIHAVLTWAFAYYFLLYLHVCAHQSLLAAAVTILPGALVIPFAAASAGLAMSKTGRFKVFNRYAFLLLIGGLAGVATLRVNPTRVQQIIYQFLYAAGAGILFPGRLMNVQASQQERNMRMATALVSVGTSIGQAFGIAIGNTIFQNEWNLLVNAAVQDGQIPSEFKIGADQVARASEILAHLHSATVLELYKSIMAVSISRIWIFCIIAGVIGFLAADTLSRDLRPGETEQEIESRPLVEDDESI